MGACVSSRESASDGEKVDPAVPLERLKSPPHDGAVHYSDIEEEHVAVGASGRHPMVIITQEQSATVTMVGGGGGNDDLREIMNQGKNDIRRAQEKLSSSLTTAIVDAETSVLESGAWLKEKKDMQRKYDVLPPIAAQKKVNDKSMSFYV